MLEDIKNHRPLADMPTRDQSRTQANLVSSINVNYFTMSEHITIGTRGSDLAVAQSTLVADRIRETHPTYTVELVIIKTTGDKRQGTPEAALLDKKAWILELEQAITEGQIDIAIHSGKDVPLALAPGTTIHSVLQRENPFDSFVGKVQENGKRLLAEELQNDARIGTASLRRAASVRRWLPDSTTVEHRGNVPTRIRKLDESDSLDGIILAAAGLNRLAALVPGLEHHPLPVKHFVPAIAQGTLIAQFRENDSRTESVVRAVSDSATETSYQAERACAALLEADCTTAVGIYAEVAGTLTLHGRVLSLDGKRCVEKIVHGPLTSPAELGRSLGKAMLDLGAAEILHETD
jgi:hydroxymethylbilane synthase